MSSLTDTKPALSDAIDALLSALGRDIGQWPTDFMPALVLSYAHQHYMKLGELHGIYRPSGEQGIRAYLTDYLAENWRFISESRTALCYTCIPEALCTRVMVKIATLLETPDKPAIAYLMPGVFTDSLNPDVYPNLDIMPLTVVLKTHILHSSGRYLVPVRLLLEHRISNPVALNNYYVDLREPAGSDAGTISESDMLRLYDHSEDTRALGEAQRAYFDTLNENDTLLAHLRRFVLKARKGGANEQGTEALAATPGMEALATLYTYYSALKPEALKKIPDVVKSKIDALMTLSAHNSDSVRLGSIDSCFTSHVASIHMAMYQHEAALSRVTPHVQDREKNIAQAQLRCANAQTFLSKSLHSGRYVGADRGDITLPIIKRLNVRLRLRNAQQLKRALTDLTRASFLCLLEDFRTSSLIRQLIPDANAFIDIALGIPDHKIALLCEVGRATYHFGHRHEVFYQAMCTLHGRPHAQYQLVRALGFVQVASMVDSTYAANHVDLLAVVLNCLPLSERKHFLLTSNSDFYWIGFCPLKAAKEKIAYAKVIFAALPPEERLPMALLPLNQENDIAQHLTACQNEEINEPSYHSLLSAYLNSTRAADVDLLNALIESLDEKACMQMSRLVAVIHSVMILIAYRPRALETFLERLSPENKMLIRDTVYRNNMRLITAAAYNVTALRLVLALYPDNPARIKAIEQPTSRFRETTALHFGAEQDPESLYLMLSLYPTPVARRAAYRIRNMVGQTILHVATSNPECLSVALTLCPTTVNLTKGTGFSKNSMVHLAARNRTSLQLVLSLFKSDAARYRALRTKNRCGEDVLYLSHYAPAERSAVVPLVLSYYPTHRARWAACNKGPRDRDSTVELLSISGTPEEHVFISALQQAAENEPETKRRWRFGL